MISGYITYGLLFCSLYFEVFLLITYLEKRTAIKTEYLEKKEGYWPSTTIIVPCWNEGETIIETVNSILDLNYPKDKLLILIINDGSTDNTADVLKIFENNPQIKIHHKKNGGKYTALNFGIENSDSDLIGCLDADSFVDKDALKNMIPYFENKKIMAVVPSINVHNPENILQKIQKIEYGWGILVRKMLSHLDAMYVTPGPFTIFRREVFNNLGNYKHAYLTEDMEMALRMQESHYKIATSHRSHVFTVTPNSFKKLYKQRSRWAYGFIKNLIDYKHLLFNKNYGNLSFYILPFGFISIVSATFVTSNLIYTNADKIYRMAEKIKTIGFSLKDINFDWFYINTGLISIISIFIILLTGTLIMLSMKLAENKIKIKPELFYFMFIYPIITPFWLISALFNTIFSKSVTWR